VSWVLDLHSGVADLKNAGIGTKWSKDLLPLGHPLELIYVSISDCLLNRIPGGSVVQTVFFYMNKLFRQLIYKKKIMFVYNSIAICLDLWISM